LTDVSSSFVFPLRTHRSAWHPFEVPPKMDLGDFPFSTSRIPRILFFLGLPLASALCVEVLTCLCFSRLGWRTWLPVLVSSIFFPPHPPRLAETLRPLIPPVAVKCGWLGTTCLLRPFGFPCLSLPVTDWLRPSRLFVVPYLTGGTCPGSERLPPGLFLYPLDTLCSP